MASMNLEARCHGLGLGLEDLARRSWPWPRPTVIIYGNMTQKNEAVSVFSLNLQYTLCVPKICPPFYFLNVCVKNQRILIIFGVLNPDIINNLTSKAYKFAHFTCHL